MANNKCKDCGCECKRCVLSDHDVHLHVEIENLKQKLLERESHIVTMETNFLNEANKFPSGELVALRDELLTWQDKYKRLYDAHRRVQRVNQGLEDKLLKLVDVCETDKNTLTKDIATLSQKLAEANYAIKKLTDDNERYKVDVSLAIQFLQCKQSNFVAHRFDSLPREVQSQVSQFMTNKKKPEEKKNYEAKSIKVPIPTFPPTAMVYSIPKSPKPDHRCEESSDMDGGGGGGGGPQIDIVSAAIMAKVLEERQKEKACAKHCDTCVCANKLKIIYEITHHNVGTQTGNYKNLVCLKCNDTLSLTQSVRIVRNTDYKKVVPINSSDSSEIAQVVKVQPNNFLIELDETSQQSNPNVHMINSDLKHPDVCLNVVNENSTNPHHHHHHHHRHHHLCNKTSPTYQSDQSAKLSCDLKGPRYCSMRLQSGSRNILLDNAHNNVAPVLYTRHTNCTKSKHGDEPPPKSSQHHHLHHHQNELSSCSSEDYKNQSLISDNSERNQQRVADWIRNNLDNNDMVSSPDNSRSDNNNARYAEMEENVKRFLFGESEFMKTVEIGKLKYHHTYTDEEEEKLNNLSSKCNNTHNDVEL